jgi:steroid 5-alpha reductase family enzyme
MIDQIVALALPGLAAALGLTTLVWLASLVKRDASIVDIFWSLGFVMLAWLYRAQVPVESFRQTLVPALVTVWGLRLAAYIFWRNRGQGEDYRYAAMRQKWAPRFPLLSLFIVFWLQGFLFWLIGMPLLQLQVSRQPAGWTWLDALGLALFAVGFFFEAVGDYQLARFKADPANQGKVMDRGLWRYTRHPNYFGDATLWWGFGCFALTTHGSLWTLVGPVLMSFLIVKVSGVALLEKGLGDTKPKYRDYVRKTSAFFPWPPRDTSGLPAAEKD